MAVGAAVGSGVGTAVVVGSGATVGAVVGTAVGAGSMALGCCVEVESSPQARIPAHTRPIVTIRQNPVFMSDTPFY